MKQGKRRLRVAFVVPHIFMNDGIRERVIFSPGELALGLVEKLGEFGVDVTLFTPGAVRCGAKNETADMGGFEKELSGRGYGYTELLGKHPAIFVSLARQVQAEVIAKAYAAANKGEYDVVHIYTNEEDVALQFAELCEKPVLFTHHDPYNFFIRYKSVFPRYRYLNFVSMSLAQRATMPADTNWVANIYHGLDGGEYEFSEGGYYFAYLGRIVEPKGVHLAIEAARRAGVKLKIAGKHYADSGKDSYWSEVIEPSLGGDIEYVGYLRGEEKKEFLRRAKALIVPSVFSEPFGMVTIEALASGTPVIGSGSGATPEIIKDGVNGFIVDGVDGIMEAMGRVNEIDRRKCRESFEERFTLERMVCEHAELYEKMSELR